MYGAPPKDNFFRALIGIVVAAVVSRVSAGWASGFIGQALGGAALAPTSSGLVVAGTAGTTATVQGAVALGLGSTVGNMAGQFIGTTIATGSVDQGLHAAGRVLTSGVVNTAFSALVPGLGLSPGSIGAQALQTVGSATAQTVVSGGSFGQNLAGAVVNTATTQASAWVANQIGNNFAEGSLGSFVSHAALGCASASARGAQCAAGAAGAVAGSAFGREVHASGIQNGASNASVSDTATFYAGLVGGTVGAVVDNQNPYSGFFAGQATAENAFANNFLRHQDVERYRNAINACAPTDIACKQRALDAAAEVSLANENARVNCKRNNNCDQLAREFREGNEALYNLLDSGMATIDIERLFYIQGTASYLRPGAGSLEDLATKCRDQACQERSLFINGALQSLVQNHPALAIAGVGQLANSLTISIINKGTSQEYQMQFEILVLMALLYIMDNLH